MLSSIERLLRLFVHNESILIILLLYGYDTVEKF